MTPLRRKLLLTTHVVASVSWLGSVAAFLALAVVGLRSDDVGQARAAYVAMDVVAWTVILPLCVASLLTGVVQSLATPWGLFRHWWIVIKLVVTLLSTLILLVHMNPISFMGDAAATMTLADHRDVRLQLVVDAAAAIGALSFNTLLSVLKPKGLTRYGWRRQQEAAAPG